MREVIRTENAPVPAGAYSQAIVSDGLVFVAGQGPRDPKTGKNAPGGVAGETRQVLTNIQAILAAAGCAMADVVKVNVYLRDVADFAEMNAVYQTFWPENPPARTTVQAIPPSDIQVEIDCIARRP